MYWETCLIATRHDLFRQTILFQPFSKRGCAHSVIADNRAHPVASSSLQTHWHQAGAQQNTVHKSNPAEGQLIWMGLQKGQAKQVVLQSNAICYSHWRGLSSARDGRERGSIREGDTNTILCSELLKKKSTAFRDSYKVKENQAQPGWPLCTSLTDTW